LDSDSHIRVAISLCVVTGMKGAYISTFQAINILQSLVLFSLLLTVRELNYKKSLLYEEVKVLRVEKQLLVTQNKALLQWMKPFKECKEMNQWK
jgi:hypothetical protein